MPFRLAIRKTWRSSLGTTRKRPCPYPVRCAARPGRIFLPQLWQRHHSAITHARRRHGTTEEGIPGGAVDGEGATFGGPQAGAGYHKDAGLNGDLDRIPQLSWVIFLKGIDDFEQRREVTEKKYRPAIEPPYRWREWAGDPDKGMTGEALREGKSLHEREG